MSGLAFPLALNAYGGLVTDVTDNDVANSAVKFTLATYTGERIGRPNFGLNTRPLHFGVDNEEGFNAMRQEIQTTFSRDLPNVSLVSVAFDESNITAGQLAIEIRWALPSGAEGVDNVLVPTDITEQ